MQASTLPSLPDPLWVKIVRNYCDYIFVNHCIAIKLQQQQVCTAKRSHVCEVLLYCANHTAVMSQKHYANTVHREIFAVKKISPLVAAEKIKHTKKF